MIDTSKGVRFAALRRTEGPAFIRPATVEGVESAIADARAAGATLYLWAPSGSDVLPDNLVRAQREVAAQLADLARVEARQSKRARRSAR